jgi:2',3'-cyclic-nucleotide 2'-phosphodiesterase
VSAVLGTHTHESTARLRRLPRGTALVTEVGMTGCPDGVMGFTPEAFVAGLRDGLVAAGEPAVPTTGPAELAAVLLVLAGGRVERLARLDPTTWEEETWTT